MNSRHNSAGDDRLKAILAEYLQALESGHAPSQQQLLSRYPEFADELREFFADKRPLHPVFKQEASANPPTEQIEVVDADVLPPTIGISPQPPTQRPNARCVGDYELLEEIARGGMGVVYRARQHNLNRIVALKMILAGKLAGEENVRRFYSEAEAAANLDHRGIVPIFEIGEHEGQHYFSMAFVAGESLAQRLQRGPLPGSEAAEIIRKVAEAIAYAHQQGVIHRDLKPANVLIDPGGEPKVTDFGLAKRMQTDSHLTGTGQILGTPSYMPPEQASGGVAGVDERSDVYALGAILYALVTGRPPFHAANPMDTLLQVLERDPPRPRMLNPVIPKDLETVVLKCLEKEPGRRYRSAQALADDLQRFLDGEPISAKPLGVFGKTRRLIKRRPLFSGCLFSLIGLLLVVGGIAATIGGTILLGATTFEFVVRRLDPAATFPLSEDNKTATLKTPVFHISTEGRCAVDLQLNIDAATSEANDSGADLPRYNFPVRYRVLDGEGNEIDAGSRRVSWGSALVNMETTSPTGGHENMVQVTLAEFVPPSDGRLSVEVTVGEDEIYGAEWNSARVQVYENVTDSKRNWAGGGALCCAGPLVLLFGIVLVLYGPILFTTRRKRPPSIR